jgi:membrane protein
MSRVSEESGGRGADEPRDIPRAGWKAIVSQVAKQIGEDNLSLVAAGSAFYVMLAIFPALAAIVSIYGLFANPETVQQQVQAVQGVLPPQAGQLVDQQLNRIASTGGRALGLGALVGFVVALWSATKGVKSLMTALNIVYGEREKRGFIKFNGEALLLTFVLLVFVVVALVGIAFVPVAIGAGFSGRLAAVSDWLRWPLLGIASIVVLDVLYRYAVCRAHGQWRWVTWGAVAATCLWLGGSALFSWYVSSFGSFNQTFGSLAAVAVLMMWLWLSAFFVLLGGELNAEIERRTGRDTSKFD